MKVFLTPNFAEVDKGDGGIRRVVEAQRKHLPDLGVELVDSVGEADLVNCHATTIEDHDQLVLSIHGLYWAEYTWDKWFLRANKYLIDGMMRAKVVTSPSDWVANSLRRGLLIDPIVAYHGIDLSTWEPEKPSNYVLWNKNRVDEICDPTPLNKLAQIARDVAFVSTFGNDALNTQIIGKQPYNYMQDFIRKSNVYLATTRETLGVGTLEAMACGVPILAWDIGGQQEIVTHGETGYLAQENNYEDLKNGLYYCLQHRDRLGANARQVIIDNWQWEHVMPAYVDAYQRALDIQPAVTVSIIITAYNLDQFLADAIESVLSQTFSDWELIIVDDNSPDRCGEIADSYAAKDSRIKVIHNSTNVYLAEARNTGIRTARGKFVMPLDADDMLGKDALGRLTRALDLDPTLHIATGSMELIEEDGRRWVSDWPHKKTIGFTEQIKKRNQIPYASMYRREVWERIGGYRRRCRSAEDADFWTRAFSYGFNAAKVTEAPTLIYRNRSASMSHTESEPDWISWFTWAQEEEMTPYAAGGPVWIYGPPVLSVVIPVGPGHEIYLQDALDSLISQTLLEWEVIVVNDTGAPLTNSKYLAGFPFVRLLDGLDNSGPAAARNRGVRAAKTDLIVFLDADDYFQPTALETLYKGAGNVDGYLYSDWFADDGEKVYRQDALDYDPQHLKHKMLGSCTGLFRKKDLDLVGGFSEDVTGWEDWDLQLKLLYNCICGTRIAEPLFVYRYRAGQMREQDFENQELLLEEIKERHTHLHRGETSMECAGCGKRSTLIAEKAKAASEVKDTTYIEYTGQKKGKRTIQSKIVAGHRYSWSATQRIFLVYTEEIPMFTKYKDFRVIKPEAPEGVPKHKTIVAERTPPPAPAPTGSKKLADTDIDPEIVSILTKHGIETLEQACVSTDATLSAYKGIGDKRLKKIRDLCWA